MRSRSRRWMFSRNSCASAKTSGGVVRRFLRRFLRRALVIGSLAVVLVVLVAVRAIAMLRALAAAGATGEWAHNTPHPRRANVPAT
jgi:hypothetical protein